MPLNIDDPSFKCSLCRKPLKLEGPAHENSAHPKCYYLHCINPPVHAEFWRFFKKGEKPTRRRLLNNTTTASTSTVPTTAANTANEPSSLACRQSNRCQRRVNRYCGHQFCKPHCDERGGCKIHPPAMPTPPLLPAVTLQPFLAGIESPAKAPVHNPRWIDPEERRVKNLVCTIAPSPSPSPSPSKQLPPAMPAPSAKYSLTVISWALRDKPARIQGLQLSVPFWRPPGDLCYEAYDAGFGHWLEVDATFIHDVSNGLPLLIRTLGVTGSDEREQINKLMLAAAKADVKPTARMEERRRALKLDEKKNLKRQKAGDEDEERLKKRRRVDAADEVVVLDSDDEDLEVKIVSQRRMVYIPTGSPFGTSSQPTRSSSGAASGSRSTLRRPASPFVSAAPALYLPRLRSLSLSPTFPTHISSPIPNWRF
ncbi:hypothetical protein DFH09DRAFT_262719 [Mycena vulgaris]|nr:hypothetical protein DFH09DRAFT_262719 [Mycena vulgaris]